MGLLRAIAGESRQPRLIVKTRCVLVADVVAIDADGKRETLVSGLEEDAAREVFLELTGRPWTRAEAEQEPPAEPEASAGPELIDAA